MSRAAFSDRLREIARKGRYLTAFDKAIRGVDKDIRQEERAARMRDSSYCSGVDSLSIATVEAALEARQIVVRLNLLTREMDVSGLPGCLSEQNAAAVLPTYLSDYLRECGVSGVTTRGVEEILALIADKNRYNPVEKYLRTGHWDGVDRLRDVFGILGVSLQRYQTYVYKWFLQTVALALNDERNPVGADGVLVLQASKASPKLAFFAQ